MRTLLVLVLAPLACLASACGGNVVVDGAGGNGGGGSGTSISSSSSSQSGTTTTTTSVTTGTGPSECDGTGFCGSGGDGGCVDCALAGLCAGALDECLNSQSCLDFSDCINNCGGDPSCGPACAMQVPQGAILYGALIDCVVCFACTVDCDGMDFGDPFPGCPIKP